MKRIAILLLFILGTYSCVYGQTWSIGAGYVSRRYGASSYYSTGVNGNQKCSIFGNYECSDFGIKTAVDSATMVQ